MAVARRWQVHIPSAILRGGVAVYVYIVIQEPYHIYQELVRHE